MTLGAGLVGLSGRPGTVNLGAEAEKVPECPGRLLKAGREPREMLGECGIAEGLRSGEALTGEALAVAIGATDPPAAWVLGAAVAVAWVARGVELAEPEEDAEPEGEAAPLYRAGPGIV